jgi:hypothetical protein
MLSARFLLESTGSWQESAGKNPNNFRPEYCFHIPAISGVFLRDTVTFSHLSCRIPRDPVPGIIGLGLANVRSLGNLAGDIINEIRTIKEKLYNSHVEKRKEKNKY